ncbi:DUF368 domain-containing protein [Methanoculleus thermophilus]|uniref:DUF368 domain-containing protein n=1 Tax=Methanoculleus thermophilus TaxID=2200 RepID=UPI000835A599|nr:DUF368 domain-containing protein [Methanoculleus thermophilus]
MNRGQGLREYAGIYLRGLAMGACDVIPGVSGGTIALITGIYERLVGAIGSIDPASVKHLFRGDFRSFRADIEKIDIPFLIVLLAGIGTAFLLMSGVILTLLSDYPVATYSFFLGLILASAVAIFLEIRSPNAATVAYLIVGTGAGYLLGGLGHLDIGHSLPILFFTGMVALCAMVLPGISGAYMTLVLNQYEFMLAALRSFSLPEIISYIAGYLLGGLGHLDIGHSLPILFFTGMVALCAMVLPGISGAYMTLVLNQYEFMLAALRSFSLPEIISYIAGGVVGLLLFTKALKYLLATYPGAMLALLTGLMLGSARMLWDKGAAAGDMLTGGWVFFLVGLVIVGAVEFAKRRYQARTA